ncbi:MAG: glycerol-3-phosphate dehydrogenase/oxidase [Chitinophagales bacterium]|nr:glycerol-3-phosphate dehydrogenase/oxidase [Chitinophagales bacterium]MCB9022395.1 glycerol-3-phosphate dehydrogenase/oxidase [Chitinophagales bacterium]
MSANSREQSIEKLESEVFDLVVIGGGITGAGIALDAASRGLSVALLEKYDFAGGTSSRSTKLIHGGLRYLKQLELGLVRKVGRERAVIHRLAPHLVRPVPMLLPVYRNGSLGRWSTTLALSVYDRLAGVKKQERFKWYGPKEVANMEPGLLTDELQGGAVYTEYRTDDARLTMAVLKSASGAGAVCLNYMLVKDFVRENNRLSAVLADDLIGGKMITVRGKLVVSAAGPWVDEIRRIENKSSDKKLQLTKGVHLVLKAERFQINYPVYADVGDGRMFFIIPRGNRVYIGTTDTLYAGPTENPQVTKDDADYLLAAANRLFPKQHLSVKDIISSWAGVRPLLFEEGKSPSELSRRDEIWETSSGLISIAGGKLTGYRTMAKEVVDKVMFKLTGSKSVCKTESLLLDGYVSEQELEALITRLKGEASQVGFSHEEIRRLVFTYGSETELIIEQAYTLHQEVKDQEKRILQAELMYCVQFEWVRNISDFFIRRTGMLYFDRQRVLKQYLPAAEIIAELLDQQDGQTREDIAFLEAALSQAVTFN